MAAGRAVDAHEYFGNRGSSTLVIPGEMAARVDRLPMSAMAWESA